MNRKTAIVTGSATGVGAAAALGFARRGYNVVINYSRSESEARETETACREAGADTALVQANVADDAGCRALAQAAVDRWGRIDALVNNAGISVFAKDAEWDALDPEVFNRIFGVNTIGAFQMVRACMPHLKSSRGSIVNVSSIAGSLGVGSSIPYIASKGALNAMTLHFARNLAPDIRVNAVCPGLVTSRWFTRGIGEAGFEKVKADVESVAPLQRASTPEDVAEAILWLADGSPTITGELLMIDGGMHLGGRRLQVVPGRS